MVYIHYRALDKIFENDRMLDASTSNIQMRQMLRNYRQRILSVYHPDLAIKHMPDGKPFCAHTPEFVFNHSHSQKHYALAWSNHVQDLGVDIEDLDRNVKMQALAKRSFHPNEYQIWQQLDYCREFWFKVWTIKEAVLKAHGMGIRTDLYGIDTQAHPTWQFGRVEHPILGVFEYQNFVIAKSILTVAYRPKDMQLQRIEFQF